MTALSNCVTISHDGNYTYVYSKRFDYMAYGKDIEEAMRYFDLGLYETLKLRAEMNHILYS